MQILDSITTTTATISFSELANILFEKGLITEKQKLVQISLQKSDLTLTLKEILVEQENHTGPTFSSQRVFTPEQEKALETPLNEVSLSVRAYNCLKSAKIQSLRELVQYKESELLSFRNFGQKSVSDIKQMLQEMELSFADES